ncbi:MAG: FprA family A-type flavoprotein [Lentimicrobiaceae bacterium]|jgi:flavorubredoxin|nr:FprA family A-type flavoprotein [Lentimicrobiaceae bacterium]
MGNKTILDVSESVKWIGVLDYNLATFDVVMETKFGTTYNSYFIKADKKTIVETVKDKFWNEYEAKLRQLTNPEEIEYIILNHTEPDHSGSVSQLIEIAPNATIVGTGNAIRYLNDLIHRPFKSIQVKDGMELDLGNKKIRFISAPNLHWPDSMYTYLEEENVLFTCDSFGAHYAEDLMFDDLVENYDESFNYYFDVILKPFSKFMLSAIEKIRPLHIKAICPGHGPILRSNWKRYVDMSEQLAKEALEKPAKKIVFIPYVSAYHKSGFIAEAIARGVEKSGKIEASTLDIEHTELGEIDSKIAMASGLIIGCPTINQNILLPIYRLFAVVNPIRDKGKLAGAFGSYGWSGEAQKLISSNLINLKLNYIEGNLFFKFSPSESELAIAEAYGEQIAQRLTE